MKQIFIFILLIPCISIAQKVNNDPFHQNKMEWFQDAKLGIFIHWGIYAVNGISESWSFYNGYISHEEYLKQTKGFTAKHYDPEYWVKLIKESGAKYAVITSKHHDGFSLWNTKLSDFNAFNSSAAAKDVLFPFIKSLKKNHIKVGLYFSLPDWTYNNYTHHTRNEMRYRIEDDPVRWGIFLKYCHGQLKELKELYDPDLWWFDGDWEHNADEWEIDSLKSFLLKDRIDVIFNSRLCGYGDYDTPEIGIPVVRPEAEYWELCMTMNDSWGFQKNDNNYKSPLQIIDIFVDCISKGGNLLLDIGPKADGTIPEEQEHILRELGYWTNKHKDAIYKSRRGIPYDHFYGPTSLSADSTVLYLFLRDIPKDDKVMIKGIRNKINRIFVVGNGTILNYKTFGKVFWNSYPGVTYIDVPEEVIDRYFTVLAIMLDGKIDLYREDNGTIETN